MTTKNLLSDLKGVLNPALPNITASLSAGLNRKVKVKLGELRPVDLEELQSNFPEEMVIAHGTFTEGISDQISFLLQLSWAATWADLMQKGEGHAEFSADEHLSSISELLNQISGAMCQHLSDLARTSVKLGPVEATVGTVESQAEQWQSFFRTEFIIEMVDFDPGYLTLLLSPQTLNDLQTLELEDEAPFEDRPPPAVLDDEDVPGTLEVRSARFEDFGPGGNGGDGSAQSIEALMDLELPVIIELGRTTLFIRDILDLCPGSIVELNKLSGEPVDLYINDKKFARGEVVVIEENFGIRITDLVKVEDRIRTLK